MQKLSAAVRNMQLRLQSEIAAMDLHALEPDDALARCALERRIGIGRLLAAGDAEAYFDGLFRSGETFLYLLLNMADRGETAGVSRTTAAPMVDALAAGSLSIAKELDSLLPNSPDLSLEDEDDFAWHSTLHAIGTGRLDSAAISREAERLGETGSDFLSVRAALLRAIAARNGDAFDDALDRLTEEWRAGVEEQRAGGVFDFDADLTEWNVFLEGIAIVRAAKALGVPVHDEYRHLPRATLSAPPTYRDAFSE